MATRAKQSSTAPIEDELGQRRAAKKFYDAKKVAVADGKRGRKREVAGPKRAPAAVGRRAHRGQGPFYDLAGAARRMHRDVGEVEKTAEAGEALMVVTIEGNRLLPAWQFQGEQVHPEIAKVVEIFRDVPVNPWMVVQWATAPDPQLGGVSAVQALHDGRDIEVVLADARRYAWKWSQ